MPPPFVAYLRVYEPLSAFEPAPRARLEKALAAGALPATEAGQREREVWLRTQLANPPRMLPGDRADGTAGEGPVSVLSLDPAEVSGADPAVGALVCPLDLRTRAAAALVGFLATAPPMLARVALPATPRGTAAAARSRAESVHSELGSRAVHVLSSTWTVPLPWFTLVDAAARRVEAVPRPDPRRRVYYRSTLAEARHRAARARAVAQRTIGDTGPALVLADTARWLSHFHPQSAVELDYGGIVQLMDDDMLGEDTSVQDVQAAVDALESGRIEDVAQYYERLRDFWAELAAFERFG